MSGAPTGVERVVLWGFMASGKSTVGEALARSLGWELVDLDREIERREGRTIAEIFAAEGEAAFRRVEVEVTREQIGRSRVVVSCGGGWVTNPESASLVPPRSLTVWLRVSPERVLERVRGDGDGPVRPLLAGDDPAVTVRRLLAAREPLYSRADLVVDTDGVGVGDIARQIETRVRESAPRRSNGSSSKAHADEG